MINEEPEYYWIRYTIKDHHRLRHQFSESEKIQKELVTINAGYVCSIHVRW